MTIRSDLLHKINSNVNQYSYDTDMSVWGQTEYWEKISAQKRGDCEDYALEKRWQCLENGIPISDIRIGICTTETGESHAVLLVFDPEAKGDWILDNRQPSIYTMDEFKGLGYKGTALQRPGHWLWEKWE